jgi:hypothetical protein
MIAKTPKSSVHISHKSDTVQALLLLKAGGDHKIPKPMASGDHNILHHQKAAVEIGKRIMEVIVVTKTFYQIISDAKYSMVTEAWNPTIEAQDHQWALAGARIGAPAMCQLPGGPSLKINPQTQEAVCVYSVFCSFIRLLMICSIEKFIVK